MCFRSSSSRSRASTRARRRPAPKRSSARWETRHSRSIAASTGCCTRCRHERAMSQKPSVRAQPLALGDIVSDRLQRLHRLWVARRGSRRWPAHADFSAEDLAFIEDTITLVDVLHEPLHFRMRRVGPSIEELRGPGDQGKLVDEIEPPVYGALLRAT